MLDPPIRNFEKFKSVKDKLSKNEQVFPRYFNVGDRKLNILHANLKFRNSCMHTEQETLTLDDCKLIISRIF